MTTSTTLIKHPQLYGRQPARVERRLGKRGVSVKSPDGAQQAFVGFVRFSRRLYSLLDQAKGLNLEIAQGLHLAPAALAQVLEHGCTLAARLKDDLIALRLEAAPGSNSRIRLVPRTFSGEAKERLRLHALAVFQKSLAEVDSALAKATTSDEAENAIMQILMLNGYKVSAVKVYDVTAEGTVQLSHGFVKEGNLAVKRQRGEIESHFTSPVLPEQYAGEAIGTLLQEGLSSLLIPDPKNDSRCWQEIEGKRVFLESQPFCFVAEKVDGKIARLYKVDWLSKNDLQQFSELAVGGIFSKLFNFNQHLEKQNLDPKFSQAMFGSLKVYNARCLTQQLTLAVEQARLKNQPLSLLYIDIDHFKHLNEAWLHAHVDHVLAEILIRIIRSLREGRLYRHGGEELVVVLPLPLGVAQKVAERIKESVARESIKVKIPCMGEPSAAELVSKIAKDGRQYPHHGIVQATVSFGRGGQEFLAAEARKTVSIGLAQLKPADDADSLLLRADRAMKLAKDYGRNQVVVLD